MLAQFIVVMTDGKREIKLGVQCSPDRFAAEVSRMQRESSNLRFEDGWKIDGSQTICRGAIAAMPATGSVEFALCPF